MELESLFDAPQSAAVENICLDSSSERQQEPIKKMGSPLDSIWRNLKVCARVEELWKDHSSTQIAAAISAEFSVTITRNSVIGYLHRAKLTSVKKVKDHPQARTGGQKRRRSNSQLGAERRTANGLRAVKPVPFLVFQCDIEPLHIGLDDLTTTNCHFPYTHNNRPTTFCGHDSVPGHSWCPSHFRVVYQPRRAAA